MVPCVKLSSPVTRIDEPRMLKGTFLINKIKFYRNAITFTGMVLTIDLLHIKINISD